jgi:hypothetical protein
MVPLAAVRLFPTDRRHPRPNHPLTIPSKLATVSHPAGTQVIKPEPTDQPTSTTLQTHSYNSATISWAGQH